MLLCLFAPQSTAQFRPNSRRDDKDAFSGVGSVVDQRAYCTVVDLLPL